MLTWIRETFGKTVIGGIIALLALVFVFYGVFTPKATRGLHDGAVAGTINGESISLAEFNSAYNRQVEYYKSMLGGMKLSEDQLKSFHIRESVFQDLARRKLMVQEGQKQGYVPADEEVRDRIAGIPAFQKDGRFDIDRYKELLEANGYTPTSFEKSVREDLTLERIEDYFRDRVNVSDAEIRLQYQITGDKRDIKYVLLTRDAGKRDVNVDPAEVQKYLADPAKLNLAKMQFEAKKNKEFKGQAFDAVKAQIARELIASTKIDEIKKATEKLATQALALLSPNSAPKGKQGNKPESKEDAKLNQLLKPYGLAVKSTGMVSRDTQYLPGMGEAKDLMADAFAAKSPINPAQGGKVKRYDQGRFILLAVVTGSESPEPEKLATEHDALAKKILTRKEHALFDTWMKDAFKKAKIDPNPSVMGTGGDAG